MPLLTDFRGRAALGDRLHAAQAMTAGLMSDVIAEVCRRFPSMGQKQKTARIERLIEAEAWSDAALALIDLELPQWQVRRIAYDEGEWHCALSRQRELPDWLDQAIEARHEDLPLAVLSAFIDAARSAGASRSSTSVPAAPRDTGMPCMPFCCDNFA
jgi:hypothetical protein